MLEGFHVRRLASAPEAGTLAGAGAGAGVGAGADVERVMRRCRRSVLVSH